MKKQQSSSFKSLQQENCTPNKMREVAYRSVVGFDTYMKRPLLLSDYHVLPHSSGRRPLQMK